MRQDIWKRRSQSTSTSGQDVNVGHLDISVLCCGDVRKDHFLSVPSMGDKHYI